jgi:hypothetical protein
MKRTVAMSIAPISCLAAAGLFVAGCAAPGTQRTSPAAPRMSKAPSSAPVSPSAQPVLPAAPAAVESAPVPPPPAPAVSTPPPPAGVVTDVVAPHFETPDAAMRYLVAAYNANNETNIKHVTTPDSRDQFEAERQWVKAFRFNNCAPDGAPTWDYTCVLDITKTMPGVAVGDQVMDEVTVIVGPAARPGYYLVANHGCGE